MYQFIIPNKKLNIYFAFALGIILLNISGYIAHSFLQSGVKPVTWIFAIVCILAIAGAFYILSPSKRLGFAGTVILIFGVFWIGKGYYQLFFANFILWLLYTIARRRLVVGVATQAVSYPSFPAKSIAWSDISNIVLKDDILTIDLKNNKIYQHLVEYPAKEVNETEFNDFCRKQLMVHSSW